MAKLEYAHSAIRDMQRLNPRVYEGIHGSFIRSFMSTNKWRWSKEVANYIKSNEEQWAHLADDIGVILWDKFEKGISC
jgi:hypothetical protein